MAYAPFLQALANEIATDPLGRGYASMTDSEVAADLNEPRYVMQVERYIQRRTLATVWGVNRAAEVLTALEGLAASDPAVRLMLDLITDVAAGGVDVSLDATRAQIDAFAASGLITADEAAALKALGERRESRAEQLGYADGVSAEWVARVRGR